MGEENHVTSQGFLDAHCHLNLLPTNEKFLGELKNQNLKGFCLGGYGPEDWDVQVDLQKRYLDLKWFKSFGLHPWWVVENFKDNRISQALDLLEERLPDAEALGECGLDFSPRFPKESHEIQEQVCVRQIQLAVQFQKPLVLHVVRAHASMLNILSHQTLSPFPGLVHGFAGSLETGMEYMRLGFMLSIGPSILKRGFQNLKHAVSNIPLECLLVETDSTRQANIDPGKEPYRFGLEDSCDDYIGLDEVAQGLSSYRQESPEAILAASTQNLIRLFNG